MIFNIQYPYWNSTGDSVAFIWLVFIIVSSHQRYRVEMLNFCHNIQTESLMLVCFIIVKHMSIIISLLGEFYYKFV